MLPSPTAPREPDVPATPSSVALTDSARPGGPDATPTPTVLAINKGSPSGSPPGDPLPPRFPILTGPAPPPSCANTVPVRRNFSRSESASEQSPPVDADGLPMLEGPAPPIEAVRRGSMMREQFYSRRNSVSSKMTHTSRLSAPVLQAPCRPEAPKPAQAGPSRMMRQSSRARIEAANQIEADRRIREAAGKMGENVSPIKDSELIAKHLKPSSGGLRKLKSKKPPLSKRGRLKSYMSNAVGMFSSPTPDVPAFLGAAQKKPDEPGKSKGTVTALKDNKHEKRSDAFRSKSLKRRSLSMAPNFFSKNKPDKGPALKDLIRHSALNEVELDHCGDIKNGASEWDQRMARVKAKKMQKNQGLAAALQAVATGNPVDERLFTGAAFKTPQEETNEGLSLKETLNRNTFGWRDEQIKRQMLRKSSTMTSLGNDSVSPPSEGAGEGKKSTGIKLNKISEVVAMSKEGRMVSQIMQNHGGRTHRSFTVPPKWFILMPDTSFRVGWDGFLAFLVIYVAIAVPLRIGFEVFNPPLFLEIFLVTFFTADMMFNFITSYEIKHGENIAWMETRLFHIGKKYVKSWFIIDLLSTVPIDLFVSENTGDSRVWVTVRLFRCLKLLRMMRLARIIRRMQLTFRLHPAMMRLIKVTFGLLCVFHIIACSYWLVVSAHSWSYCYKPCGDAEAAAVDVSSCRMDNNVEGILADDAWDCKNCEWFACALNPPGDDVNWRVMEGLLDGEGEPTEVYVDQASCEDDGYFWVNRNWGDWICLREKLENGRWVPVGFPSRWAQPIEVRDLSFGTQYIRAMNWAMEVCSGRPPSDGPESDTERGFTLGCMLLGLFLYAIVVSACTNGIAELDSADGQKRRRLDQMQSFLRQRRIARKLEQEILTYYEYRWDRNLDSNTSQGLFADLHPNLKRSLDFALNHQLVCKVPMFQDITEACLEALMRSLEPRIFLPGEWVIMKGEVGREMCFVARGKFEVYIEISKQPVAIIADGGFFGEMALLSNTRRNASIRSMCHGELLILNQEDFDMLRERFPIFSVSVEKFAPHIQLAKGWDKIRHTIRLTRKLKEAGIGMGFVRMMKAINKVAKKKKAPPKKEEKGVKKLIKKAADAARRMSMMSNDSNAPLAEMRRSSLSPAEMPKRENIEARRQEEIARSHAQASQARATTHRSSVQVVQQGFEAARSQSVGMGKSQLEIGRYGQGQRNSAVRRQAQSMFVGSHGSGALGFSSPRGSHPAPGARSGPQSPRLGSAARGSLLN